MIYLIFLFLSFFAISKEFLYPIASTKDSKKIYVLYQKNIHHTELWLLNLETNIAKKCLMSSFNPAGVKLIPESDNFSFIDNGLLKIKEKNNPVYSIDFQRPLYDFHITEWLDETVCYFSARIGRRFCIFLCDKNIKYEKMLIERDSCARINEDFMYPQIINDKIYFISKSVHKVADSNYEIFGNYKILCSHFNQAKKIANPVSEVVLRLGEKSVAFLKMTSNEEGFFIGHPSKISKHEKLIKLKYFHLQKNNSEWEHNKLFDFRVPLDFLMNKSEFRLYESIVPFLPKHFKDTIYYSSVSEENKLNIFAFNISSSTSKNITADKFQNSIFSPILIGDELFFGGSIENEKPPFFLEEEKNIKIILPKISV